MRAMITRDLAVAASAAVLATGCASESHRVVETESVPSSAVAYSGPRYELVVGKFSNASPYMRGIFSDGTDRLGGQAETILETHLSQSGRFTLVERDNMEELSTEAGLRGEEQALIGAQVLLTGEVTEFGRKTAGDRQLFGILGRGKTQTAYSKVSLNVVDVRTSQVIYSVQGAGEYDLSDRQILGTGGDSGYDATLNGKVLDLSIRDAVNKLVAGLESGAWSPSGAR